MNIFYITQFFDVKGDKALGGVLIRKKQLELFAKNNLDVTVVMPIFSGDDIYRENNIIYIPFFYNKKICDFLERTTLWPDQYYSFSKRAYRYLKTIVKKNDTLFCVTGGTMETVLLGKKLKKKIGCKLFINFQDPFNHTSVNGHYVDNSLRLKRDRFEKPCIESADIIITSSATFQKSLIKKYPSINAEKVLNIHFGYVENAEISNTNIPKTDLLSLMYSGIYGRHQQPEKICRVFEKSGFRVYFIGRYKDYYPIQPYLSAYNFIDFLPHKEFLGWVDKNTDIGLVSLTSEYLSACVPSKIYEYINLELPVIGFLPDGDAKDIINNNGYGKIFHYDDEIGFKDFVKKNLSLDFIKECKERIRKDKKDWSMENTFKVLLSLFKDDNRQIPFKVK